MTTATRRFPPGTLLDAQGRVVPRLGGRLGAMLSGLGTFGGGYNGARYDRRALQDWTPLPRSADADSIADLPTLRARSRDLVRNAPLAGGAIATVVTNAIGTGLTPQPRVDAEYLAKYGVTEVQADAVEATAARLWRYHSDGRFFDVAGLETHEQLQGKVLRGVLESGDMLTLDRFKPNRPGALFAHAVQLIEADRISNPDPVMNREGFAGGVESDADGAPVFYHVASRHVFDLSGFAPVTWDRVPARGKSGRRITRLVAWRRRPRQSRGIPYLAPVIEPLKQLDRYGEAELMAAVVAAMFTVFIKSDYAGEFFGETTAIPGSVPLGAPGTVAPPVARLGTGAVVRLQTGEDITVADTKRPNALYSPFVQAKLEEIGVGLEIPFELLIKHFTQSYSAARASRLEFWKFLAVVRGFMAADFCQPDYDAILAEAFARDLAGETEYFDLTPEQKRAFFDDPLARQAFTGCWWVGPAPGQIDELKEINAAVERVNNGFSTLEEETAALTGGSWERNHRQQVKERRARERDGLDREPVAERIRTEPLTPEGEPPKETTDPDKDVDGADREEDEESKASTGARR